MRKPKEPFKSAVIPFSKRERERDDDVKGARLRLGLKRRRAAPRGRYDTPPSEQTKAYDLRKSGESL